MHKYQDKQTMQYLNYKITSDSTQNLLKKFPHIAFLVYFRESKTVKIFAENNKVLSI